MKEDGFVNVFHTISTRVEEKASKIKTKIKINQPNRFLAATVKRLLEARTARDRMWKKRENIVRTIVGPGWNKPFFVLLSLNCMIKKKTWKVWRLKENSKINSKWWKNPRGKHENAKKKTLVHFYLLNYFFSISAGCSLKFFAEILQKLSIPFWLSASQQICIFNSILIVFIRSYAQIL